MVWEARPGTQSLVHLLPSHSRFHHRGSQSWCVHLQKTWVCQLSFSPPPFSPYHCFQKKRSGIAVQEGGEPLTEVTDKLLEYWLTRQLCGNEKHFHRVLMHTEGTHLGFTSCGILKVRKSETSVTKLQSDSNKSVVRKTLSHQVKAGECHLLLIWPTKWSSAVMQGSQ